MKSVILQDVQDQPSSKLNDIRRKFKYDYGIELSYYYEYSGKQKAMKDTYDEDSISYHNLYSYMNQLVESNPNSYVVLQKHPGTQKFMCLFVSFGSCISGFSHC